MMEAPEKSSAPGMTKLESAPGRYWGYSHRLYDSSRRYHIYVPLDDGTKLSVVYYIPWNSATGPAGPLPAVVCYTPYDHLSYDRDKKSVTANDDFGLCNLIPFGYVVCFAHVRGCAASFGTRVMVNSRQEAADGAEIIEWIAAQEFCSGKVMTSGMSYNGQTQLEIISQKPKHLLAAYVGKTDFNRYDGWIRNGIARAFGSSPDRDWGNTKEEIEKTIDAVTAMTVPTDDDKEKTLLRQAVSAHVKNGSQAAMLERYPWRDSYAKELQTEPWVVLSASTYLDDINASEVAVYIDGGNMDVFRRDTFMMYQNLKLPKKMIIGPWDHIGPKTTPSPWIEMLRWADYWLKGINNGVMEEAPVALRVTSYDFKRESYQGEGTGRYRYEYAWPAAKGKRTEFYLTQTSAGRRLSRKRETLASGETYASVFGISTSVESKYITEEDGCGAGQKGLVYCSDPMETDTDYIGHPMAYLSFVFVHGGDLAQPCDLDFFVTLADYDPETDRAFQFGNGWLRSSLRHFTECGEYDFMSLPWHENKVGSNEYLIPGEEYHLEIDLMPVLCCLKAGHRLVLAITNSHARTYYHGRREYEQRHQLRPPVIRLITGGNYGSRLVMPNIYESEGKS